MTHLDELAQELLNQARAAANGRAAHLVVHDGPLRQTVIALTAGTRLPEHNSPPAASLHVIRGQVTVTAQETSEIARGQIAALTHHRHSVVAMEDSVFLLTTVTGIVDSDSHHNGTDAELGPQTT